VHGPSRRPALDPGHAPRDASDSPRIEAIRHGRFEAWTIDVPAETAMQPAVVAGQARPAPGLITGRDRDNEIFAEKILPAETREEHLGPWRQGLAARRHGTLGRGDEDARAAVPGQGLRRREAGHPCPEDRDVRLQA
jgi:hypothetical protein